MAAIDFEDVRISCEDGLRIASAILRKIGMSGKDAETVAANLVFADKRGVTTHGLSRMKTYCDRAKTGNCNPVPDIRILKETRSAFLLDGDRGFGAVVGTFAMKKVISKAKETGVAFGVARNSTHYGAAAFYTLMAAEQGMIGFSCTNGVPNMAPFGSFTPMLGTNPFSLAAPAADHPPVVLDIASSAVARGNIINAAREGAEIPAGWALDQNGRPTTDANEALKGCVVPFGGHKGSGIAVFIDILSGVLSGDVFGPEVRTDKMSEESGIIGPGISHTFAAIDISAFQDVDAFRERMAEEIRTLKSGKKAEGVQEILVPGEIEARKEERAEREGLWLSKSTFRNLCLLSEEYGIGIDPRDHIRT